ncbi:hypothetical protein BRADI_2g20640v3 [Brachypodium distachyon]|uniref:RING-type domain-containing protein n=2 Tax=Brachypodium distachyon TaxID=15368 RepID=A0A2K2D9K9_BRADI|nr:hypothetical protein BRADI_2g20640v3 [Brachypodium distachyon]
MEAVDSDDDDSDDAAGSSSPCPCDWCRSQSILSGEQQPEEEPQEARLDEAFYGSDDDDDDEVDVPLKIDGGDQTACSSRESKSMPLIPRRFVPLPEGRNFVGPAPRFASAGNTAGFLRVYAEDEETHEEEEGKKQRKEILVLYRCTRFVSNGRRGGRGVKASGGAKLHELRFVVPDTGDAAGSLPWAGSSLAPLIYPVRHSRALQALWSRLVSTVRVPPRAGRVQVLADVGILRRRDYTPRRMERVRARLERMMAAPWPGYHVAMELQLPEPVLLGANAEAAGDEEDDTDGGRPAKRRKVVADVAGQECPVCFELLESGLAAWPGCSLPHVFHGECLELCLKESEACPICRRKLSAPTDG